MKIPVISVSIAVVLLALGCSSGRRGTSGGARRGDPSGEEASRSVSGTPVCSDSCELAMNGICEDGASDARGDDCPLGTDCSDCGTRYTGGSEETDRSTGSASCECDYYEGECECDCDPDCDGFASPDAGGGSTGLGGFGDECECYDALEGFCESSDCGGGLSCFGIEGWGVCTTPCSSFDVGSYDVCPSGGQCQEFPLSETWYLCMPT